MSCSATRVRPPLLKIGSRRPSNSERAETPARGPGPSSGTVAVAVSFRIFSNSIIASLITDATFSTAKVRSFARIFASFALFRKKMVARIRFWRVCEKIHKLTCRLFLPWLGCFRKSGVGLLPVVCKATPKSATIPKSKEMSC